MFKTIKLVSLFIFLNLFLVNVESYDDADEKLSINWSNLASDTETKIESHVESNHVLYLI
jgi:hypothetical protein